MQSLIPLYRKLYSKNTIQTNWKSLYFESTNESIESQRYRHILHFKNTIQVCVTIKFVFKNTIQSMESLLYHQICISKMQSKVWKDCFTIKFVFQKYNPSMESLRYHQICISKISLRYHQICSSKIQSKVWKVCVTIKFVFQKYNPKYGKSTLPSNLYFKNKSALPSNL